MKTLYMLALVLMLVPSFSFAATSGSLTLSGTVAVVNSIAIAPNASSTSLDIVGGETAKLVAQATEVSNNAAGYKIQMYSNNGGELRHSVDATKKTVYQISYDGGAYVKPPLSGAPATVKNVNSLSQLTTAVSDIKTNVTALPTAIAGTYSDVVVLSIVAN
jgi:hypothetical protein